MEQQGSTTTATYTYGNALIRKDGETPLFDGFGSERTVTNSSQTVTATATYEGFGQTVATTGSSTDPYMFAATSGYRNDGDAGLMHVGARYYDAQVGRFITRDTYLDQKPYLYCEHDPINGLDPNGHEDKSVMNLGEWVTDIGAIVALTGVATGGVGTVAGVYIAGAGAVIHIIGKLLPDPGPPGPPSDGKYHGPPDCPPGACPYYGSH